MKWIKRGVWTAIVLVFSAFYAYHQWPSALYDSTIDPNTYQIEETTHITQQFAAQENHLEQFKIKLAHVSKVDWQLLDADTHEVVVSGTIQQDTHTNNQWYTQSFSGLANSQQKTYQLQLISDTAFQVYVTQKSTVASQLLDKDAQKVLAITLVYHYFSVETWVTLLLLIAYIAGFIRLLYRLFK